jgi:hypothetical protein
MERDDMKKLNQNLTVLHGKDVEESLRLIVLSEGYRTAELDQFRADADAAVKMILRTSPFARIPMCIARVDMASNTSSAYRSMAHKRADTAFHSHFDEHNPHLLRVDDKRVMAAVRAALPVHWGEHKIVVLVNAPDRFGGGGEFFASARGQASGIAVVSNANGSETLMHELGHTFGLADEYAGSPIMGDSPPNVATSPNHLPAFWRARLSPNVKRPTVSNDRDVVGVFPAETGAAHYRPQYSCIMKTSSSLDRYCKVCAEWIETNFMTTSLERKAA